VHDFSAEYYTTSVKTLTLAKLSFEDESISHGLNVRHLKKDPLLPQNALKPFLLILV